MRSKRNKHQALRKEKDGSGRIRLPKDIVALNKGFWKTGATFIITLGAVVASIAAIKGNFVIAAIVLSVLLIGSFLLICSYLLFGYSLGISKRPSSFRTRRWTVLGIISIALITIATLTVWEYRKSIPPDKIMVLLADFEGDDPQKYDTTRIIYEQLSKALKKYPEVRCERLGQVIKADTSEQETEVAQRKGTDYKASIVLWGRCIINEENVRVTTHFEVLRKPKALSMREKVQTRSAAVTELRGFTIQEQLSNEMIYLTLLTIGLVCYEANDYDGAIARFTDALNQPQTPEQKIDQIVNPGDIYLYRGNSHLIKCECDTGRLDQAISDFTQAIVFRPDEYAYNNRGVSYYQKGELDKAIVDFSTIIEMNPTFDSGYYNRALAYKQASNYDKALADFSKAISLDPDARVYDARGGVYRDKGDLDFAIADYNQALEIDHNFVEAYVNRAGVYLDKGEIDRSIIDLSAAISIRPGFAPAYHNRGVAYDRKGEAEKAIADYTQAIRLNPDLVQAYHSQGLAYAEIGDTDEAMASFTQAIVHDPEYADAYTSRANIYKANGEYDKAIVDYNRAIHLNPNDFAAYVNRGIVHSNQENYDQALADFNQALKIYPERADIYANRALIYQHKGNIEKAMADYDLAITLGPDWAALTNRGLYYSDKGQFNLALSDFGKAIQIYPDRHGAYLNRAITYLRRGDRELAIQDLLKVRSLASDAETIQMVEQWLHKSGVK